MSKNYYSKDDVLNAINEAKKDMSLFYKAPFKTWSSKTTDTNEYCTEIVSDWLLKNFEKLDEILTITRSKSYKTKGHDGIQIKVTNRKEEIIAKELFRQSNVDRLGVIIDYQTPLKNKQTDIAGKIDLLAYDSEQKILRILELKEPNNDADTMLSCVLEGYTYLRIVDIPKLLSDFGLPEGTKVVANPLVFKNGAQHQEMLDGRPKLEQLMSKLNCYPLYLREDNGKYIVVNELEYKN